MTSEDTQSDIRRRALAQTAGEKTLKKILSISNENEFKYEADLVFLKGIFKQSGLRLGDLTSRGYEEELDNWDRQHLGNLVLTLPKLLNTPENIDKFQYLVSHSVQGDLVDRLRSDVPGDRFSQYNANVIRDLEKMGIDSRAWLEHGNSVFYASSLNPLKPFSIQSINWSRDFRSEYSMGNISECCIALDDKEQDGPYKRILLDYFLDLGIKVLHLSKFSDEESMKKIGQVYLAALDLDGTLVRKGRKLTDDNQGPCLGVTAIEIAQEYKDNDDIVVPIIYCVEKNNEILGYNHILHGLRFNMLTEYIRDRKNAIGNLSQVLKQRRQNINQRRNMLKMNKEDPTDLSDQIKTLDMELYDLGQQKGFLLQSKRFQATKPGVQSSFEQNVGYLGTDYLDICGVGSHDGFFSPDDPSYKVQGYISGRSGYFMGLENTLFGLRKKYVKRFQQS